MVAADFALWIITVLPHGSYYEVQGRCDLVELNHRHDEKTGEHQFTQLIAWDWSPEYNRFDAQGWALVTDWKRNANDVVVDVMMTPRIIRLRCDYYRETWTQHDPEVENQKLFPTGKRRKVW